jgi:hypothetical protein
MSTLIGPTSHPRRPEGTHPTMTAPTRTETVSPDVVRPALLNGATFLRCSIWRHAAESLVESRAGPGLHPPGNATGSRDAP